MSNNETFPIKLEKAGITIAIELDPITAASQSFCVCYTRKGKSQKESIATLEAAKARAQQVLDKLVEETYPITLDNGGILVKIYLTPTTNGYDAFTVSYYQEGKRKREQFGKLETARKRAKDIHGDLIKGEVEGASMTIQDRNAYLRALQHLEPTGVSLESACREFAKAFEILRGVSVLEAAKYYASRHTENITIKTVREVVDEFLEAKAQGRSTRIKGKGRTVSELYLYGLRQRLDKVANRFNCPIGSVTAEEINRFVHELKGCKVRFKKGKESNRPVKALSGRTKNNFLQAINVLFAFAKKQKYLPKDFAVMDEVDLAEEADFDIEIFTPDEITKLLSAARVEVLPLLAIGAFSGIRTAEICRLDWSEISLEKRLIEIKQGKSKTRSRRLVPITDNLALFLKDYAQPSGPLWSQSLSLLIKSMTRASIASGVKWKHNALRHSFISYRVAKIKNVNEVSMEAGNSPDMIFKHYRELVTEKEADAWFGITPQTVTAAREKAEKKKAAKVVALPKTEAA